MEGFNYQQGLTFAYNWTICHLANIAASGQTPDTYQTNHNNWFFQILQYSPELKQLTRNTSQYPHIYEDLDKQMQFAENDFFRVAKEKGSITALLRDWNTITITETNAQI